MNVLLLCTLSALCVVQCRKYDIETESVKLYGENLDAVLLRFRKSPEYLSILKDRVAEMRTQLNHICEQVSYYYANLLEEKAIHDSESQSNHKLRDLRSLRRKKKRGLRKPRRSSRQGNSGSRLDQYAKQRQILSPEKVNHYRDVGYEYAGHVIHNIIKHMGADDMPARSTMQPDFQKKTSTTTEHLPHLIISTDSGVAMPDSAQATEPGAAFRYTYRARSSARQ